MKLTAIALLALAALTSPAWAVTKTVTLSVPAMHCAVCPITVRKALFSVGGVEKVEASLERKEAVVVYDDAKTSISDLIKATTEAGYPSAVKQ